MDFTLVQIPNLEMETWVENRDFKPTWNLFFSLPDLHKKEKYVGCPISFLICFISYRLKGQSDQDDEY